MKLSFKSYLALESITKEELAALSEEQLDEIFGMFSGGQKPKTREELEAERAALKAKQAGKAKHAQELKDKQALDRERMNLVKKVGTSTMVPSGRTSQAAQGRAAELEFTAGAAK